MQAAPNPDTLFDPISDDLLLDPAGYAPEELRGWLRTGGLNALFAPDSTARGNLEIVRAAATRSVELSLSLGITVSLFTDPVRRHRPDLWRDHLEAGYRSEGRLGGMMITEPGAGTDLTACQTEYREDAAGPHLTGLKHWAGLTALADDWLVLARDDADGRRSRLPSLNFYVCHASPESFRLLKRYGTAGLRSIPYGLSRLDVRAGLLGSLLTGNRAERFRQIHSILHRSRISIAAITCGACARMADDLTRHVRTRVVFGKALGGYGQVRARMTEIAGARAVTRVLHETACRAAEAADAPGGGEVPAQTANIVKVAATDLAFAAANSASQLLGGDSYRMDTYAGRAAADLRPFRIFEGSNDVLCDAIEQAAGKAEKTGGPTLDAAVRAVFERAGRGVPPLPGPPAGEWPQGERCLRGRLRANAAVADWCAEAGLTPNDIQPLLTRMERDLHALARPGGWTGLVEY